MLKQPTPKKLDTAEVNNIIAVSSAQTGRRETIKSYDPENYPVFDIPINSKVLAYVPNHTVSSDNGMVSLRWDKFAAHAVRVGRQFGYVRCTQGHESVELGFDGNCPACDGYSECWELYNAQIKDIAQTKGVDLSITYDKFENDPLYQEKKQLREFAVNKPEIWLTFPIVVVEAATRQDGKLLSTPKLDASGQLAYKVMWYSIRESTYTKKWAKALEEFGDGSTMTPAGLWVSLNFEYTPEKGEPDKMGSANNLAVTFKQLDDSYKAWEQKFDQESEGWTPAKAMEVVALDALRDMSETVEAVTEAMAPTRDKLAVRKSLLVGTAGTMPTVQSSNASASLASFGVESDDMTQAQTQVPAQAQVQAQAQAQGATSQPATTPANTGAVATDSSAPPQAMISMPQ